MSAASDRDGSTMVTSDTWSARRDRIVNGVTARLAGRARPATGFVSAPEPVAIGHFARGRQLIAGNFLFAGHLIEAPGLPIWDIGPEDAPYAPLLHGFGWLDDVAAVGDARARTLAQNWVFDWIGRYDRGAGPGWTPDLTGRRLIRWISHALFLLHGQDADRSGQFYRSLSRQTVYLSHRWRKAAPGLPRFEAVTGLIYAGLSLEGMAAHVAPAVRALAQDCATGIDAQGGLPTRNPEELLDVFALLTWAAAALASAGQAVPDEQTIAIARIVPTLRALRHADGGLARFHGGGRGVDGRLDQALAASGVRRGASGGLRMGYARIAAGRSTIVLDAAAPPQGPSSSEAHASTLAFELTSGRRPMIVNCGSGATFGSEWRRAGRATPSHSTLGIDGYSSSRLGPPRRDGSAGGDGLIDVPTRVDCEMSVTEAGQRIELAHNGWQRTHGLTHARIMTMDHAGRDLAGEDILTTLGRADEARFDQMLDTRSLQGIAFSIRFHLHPEVDAAIDMGGTAISLALKSGEVWILRQDGAAAMTLEQSVYLESGRLRPRGSSQVVLTGRAIAYATRVRWSLAKAQDTPDAVRDHSVPRWNATDDD